MPISLISSQDADLRRFPYQKNDGTKASVLEVIADSVQFLEKREQLPNEEMEIPEFDDVQPTQEESKNLDSIEFADDDLPF